jgi:adhesin transport system outer membrane protein
MTGQTALDAARAHFDVQRYRRLVQLAEDNDVQHRYAYLQIQSRYKAGVGRGVDREQAGARVALAESNLSTEVANLRDKTCRDTRQTAAVAYNDTRKLADQLVYLDRNTLAIEKARDAYRQQFDIGQRSLLDLLNAENEVYTARRAYANAEYDLGYAYARVHAALYDLGATLGVSRVDNVANDASGWEQGEDAPTRCPVRVADILNVDHSELDARARRLAASAPLPVPAAPMPAAAASAPARKP